MFLKKENLEKICRVKCIFFECTDDDLVDDVIKYYKNWGNPHSPLFLCEKFFGIPFF